MSATAISATIFTLEENNGYVSDSTKVISFGLTVHGLNDGRSNGIISGFETFLDAEEARQIIAQLQKALNRL